MPPAWSGATPRTAGILRRRIWRPGNKSWSLWEFLRDSMCPVLKILLVIPQRYRRGARSMIDGGHILTAEELVACTCFPDRIAAGNYDIDIPNPRIWHLPLFFPDGLYYTFPIAA